LAGLDKPDFLQGQSLVPILKSPQAKGHPAIAYKGGAQTIRTDTHRLIAHRGGELELYDHTTPEGETKNLAAAQPDKATELLKQLQARLAK
jgi:iduronate 2-sulfatase